MTWRFRSLRSFFGLDHSYSESVYEQMFALVYHGKISLIEAYNLPIGLRVWFIKRLKRQFDEEKNRQEDAQKQARRPQRFR